MISMHCPTCGAEGRIPNDKVNVQLTCKRCCKGFFLTPEGHIAAGSPPDDPHAHLDPHGLPGHELDHVDEEFDLVVGRIRELLPKVAMGLGALLLLFLIWPFLRGEKPQDVPSRVTLAAQA